MTGAQPERDPLNGFTPEQVEMAFERIASMAKSASDALGDNHQHAAEAVIEFIGALADHMGGNNILPSVGRWACGPYFTNNGKEVKAR